MYRISFAAQKVLIRAGFLYMVLQQGCKNVEHVRGDLVAETIYYYYYYYYYYGPLPLPIKLSP